MPNDIGASALQRLARRCSRARVAAGVALTSIAIVGVFAAASASGASGAGASRADALRIATSSDAASVLGSPGLSARDEASLAAIERYTQIASQPTATSVPPTATPAPPSPTPRPELTHAHPVAVLAPPTAPAPTSTPVPPAPATPPATQPSGLDTSPMDAYAQTLFDDTNRRRASQNLPPLRVNGYLIGIARIRSQDMADHNYFAHVSPITGDNAFTLMDKHGVPYSWAGENLAKNNYSDGEAVGVADVALWNSPPHRENILNPHYTDMGVALVIDPSGMKYFTIIFTGPG